MSSFHKRQSLHEFQDFIGRVYGVPDDRLFSVWDLLTQQQRFVMRALKGIRKGDRGKLKTNLLISFAWLMALANRLHINVELEAWKRFPGACSYCGKGTCVCKKTRPSKRKKMKITKALELESLADFQKMFAIIYPAKARTLTHAGVHLAEEMGEVSEAVHNFLGQHTERQFDKIRIEIADYTSCIFGVANSAKINFAEELASMFHKNCHICHHAPCVCSFAFIADLKT